MEMPLHRNLGTHQKTFGGLNLSSFNYGKRRSSSRSQFESKLKPGATYSGESTQPSLSNSVRWHNVRLIIIVNAVEKD